MMNHKKELPCQDKAESEACPRLCSPLLPLPLPEPVTGSELVQPFLQNPKKPAPEDISGCPKILKNQNQGQLSF